MGKATKLTKSQKKGFRVNKKLQTYIEQLLEQIADEVNVKQVVLERDDVYAIYKFDTLKRKGSMEDWVFASLLFDGDIIRDMEKVREIIAVGLKQRAEHKIKVRQPLLKITIKV